MGQQNEGKEEMVPEDGYSNTERSEEKPRIILKVYPRIITLPQE